MKRIVFVLYMLSNLSVFGAAHTNLEKESNDVILSEFLDLLVLSNVKDRDGNSPLHLAILNNCSTNVISLIIKKQIDLFALNNKGETPEDLAVKCANYEVAQILKNKKISSMLELSIRKLIEESSSVDSILDYSCIDSGRSEPSSPRFNQRENLEKENTVPVVARESNSIEGDNDDSTVSVNNPERSSVLSALMNLASKDNKDNKENEVSAPGVQTPQSKSPVSDPAKKRKPEIDSIDLTLDTDDTQEPLKALLNKKHKATGNIDTQCDLCRYKARNKANFDVHKKRHTLSKTLKCEICDYLCLHPGEMSKHKKRKHTETVSKEDVSKSPTSGVASVGSSPKVNSGALVSTVTPISVSSESPATAKGAVASIPVNSSSLTSLDSTSSSSVAPGLTTADKVILSLCDICYISFIDEKELSDHKKKHSKLNEKGWFVAIKNGRIDMAEKLLSRILSVNIKDELGNTALHIAISKKDKVMINMLIKNKDIDLSLKNNELETAQSLAIKSEDAEIISIFENLNKRSNPVIWALMNLAASKNAPSVTTSSSGEVRPELENKQEENKESSALAALTCKTCNKIFKSISELADHIKVHKNGLVIK